MCAHGGLRMEKFSWKTGYPICRLPGLGARSISSDLISFRVMAGLVPATPIIFAPCLTFGVAGTSPATTPICDLSSIQRLDLDDRTLVVVADPERHRRGGIVDEDAADVGLARQQILDKLAGLRIEPRHPVVEHRSGPYLAVLIDPHVVGRRPRGWHLPFPELFGL